MKTWSAFWMSRTGRGRAANHAPLVAATVITQQPTGNRMRTTVTRTSSGCKVTPYFPLPPSSQNCSLSVNVSLAATAATMKWQQHVGKQKPLPFVGTFYWTAPLPGLLRSPSSPLTRLTKNCPC